MKDIEQARRFYLTEPSLGVFVVNYQLPGQDEVSRFEVTADQARGFIADGAAMAYRVRENAA
jgi:hypothetical protein